MSHESHGRGPRFWIGIVVPAVLGGCLLALGTAWSAPAIAGWGLLNLVAALGIFLRATWGFLLAGLLGVVLCGITGFVALFSILLLVSERGSLDDPMFGTGIVGVLNGWASLALYGLLLAAGVVMIATAWRDRTGGPGVR